MADSTKAPNNVSFSRIPPDAEERWQTVRDVCAGDQYVRAGGYLPVLNKSDNTQPNLDRNAAYVTRAVFYAATSFTRDGLIGLAFRVDPRAELPDYLQYALKDIDGSGTSLYQQSQGTLTNVLEVGRHGLYVDYSPKLRRSVIKAYRAEDIRNWRYAEEDGEKKLEMVILRETIEDQDEYSFTERKQYRELRLIGGECVVRLWTEGAKPEDPPIAKTMKDANGLDVMEIRLRSKGKVLNYIPFQFVGSRTNDAEIDPSPLYALARMNIAHFRNSADHEDSVFFTGQVQPVISGLDEEWRDFLQQPFYTDANGDKVFSGNAIYVGSRTPIPLPAGGKFEYAQAGPNTLVAEAMKDKERLMVSLGARLLESSLAAKTATGENNDREASTSVLAMCCANVTEAYQIALGWAADYMDKTFDAESAYKISQDFVRMATDSTIMQALVSAWQTGVIAKTDVRSFFRKLGVLPTEREDKDIDADLDSEPPPLALEGAEPGAPKPKVPPSNKE